MSMSIKKGDKVEVLSGKDRGKQGVVLRALPSEGKVIVEGVKRTRVGHEAGELDGHKTKLRICKKCGHKF